MKNIAVMYHYVKERDGWKGIFPLSPKDFEKQIDELGKTYEIISVDEIDTPRTKPWCVLTFDDGTKDQYTYAFEILKRKGIPAYFAVMSGPYTSGIIPVIHLVHTVLSFVSDAELWEHIRSNYDTTGVEEASARFYSYEPDQLRRFNKYMLNVRFTPEEATRVLEPLFSNIFPDKNKFIQEYYLSEQDIKQMHREGMTIGVHCYRHIPYNGNPQEFYDSEIKPCRNYLESLLGAAPKWYTPAFGGGTQFHLMKEELTPLLISNGFKGAFSTQPNKVPDNRGFWVDRIDCSTIQKTIMNNLNGWKI